MKWRQCRYTGKFYPVDEAAQKHDDDKGLSFMRGRFEPFISPVDGSHIRSPKDLDSHNKRNGVVNMAEYSPEYLERKQAERIRRESGERTRAETLAVKRELYEKIIRAENGLPI
jgi:hypothetical protein